MYAYIIDGVVQQIVPDFVPEFPNVPIYVRYPSAFVDKCIHYNVEDIKVKVGMIYNADTQTFSVPKYEPVAKATVVTEDVTQDEINCDFDYRLCCLELGLV